MSARLQAYLALERAVVDLDTVDDEIVESLRDQMDGLWYGMSDAERLLLDRRTGPPASFAGAIPVRMAIAPPNSSPVLLMPTVLEVLGA